MSGADPAPVTLDRASRLSWAEIPAKVVGPGITRQVVHGTRQTMIRYVYAPGAVFPVHAHPQEQVTLVMSGRIAFEVDGQRIELGAGDLAILPGGIPHGARVIGEEPVETFNALSPRREANPAIGEAGTNA